MFIEVRKSERPQVTHPRSPEEYILALRSISSLRDRMRAANLPSTSFSYRYFRHFVAYHFVAYVLHGSLGAPAVATRLTYRSEDDWNAIQKAYSLLSLGFDGNETPLESPSPGSGPVSGRLDECCDLLESSGIALGPKDVCVCVCVMSSDSGYRADFGETECVHDRVASARKRLKLNVV